MTTWAEPIPCDPSRGHHLSLASWKIMDGGVVEWRFQSFCKCYWSQPYPTSSKEAAEGAYEAHLTGKPYVVPKPRAAPQTASEAPRKPYIRWYGPCARCGQRDDRAFLPDSDWLVCPACYVVWGNLPDEHPSKLDPPGSDRPKRAGEEGAVAHNT